MPDQPVGNAINTVERLGQRIACNLASSQSFQRFVLRLLELRADDCALDIGCGLGYQLLPVAEKVRRVVGLDVSADLVAALRRRLTRANAEVVLGDMDHLTDLDLGDPFTLAYSMYSIYYSADPTRVVRAVAGLLAGPRSRFVVVAPDLENNETWYSDLSRLYKLPSEVLESPGICRAVILPAFLDVFGAIRCSTFRSDVRFASVDELMRYYDACAPYCRPDKREEAREFFSQKLDRDGCYWISKRSLGLVGRLGRTGSYRPTMAAMVAEADRSLTTRRVDGAGHPPRR